MQEEVTRKTIALAIKTAKLDGKALQAALRKFLQLYRKSRDAPRHGKQTLKQLMRHSTGVSNIEVTDANIKAFESTAKKYGIDFALKKADDRYFAMRLAAACTNRKPLPGMETLEPFNIIYQTAEDGLGDTVKPRLIEADADLERVLVIDDRDTPLTLADERIARAIRENNAKLVIIDPVQAFLGADVDMNRANEVRPIFRSLGDIAYTVCQHFGLDTSDYSFGYVAGWSSDKDIKELRTSLETIRAAASELITEIEGHFAELQQQRENTFSIYQLKDSDEMRDYRFEPLDRLRAVGLDVQRDNYDLVYSVPLKEGETLEDIYRRFNIDHPADFTGHSLSVSDIVVLRREDSETAHYCDSFGFAEVPEFLQQAQTIQREATQEEAMPVIEQTEQDEPAPAVLTPLQEKSLEIAKKYETLPMQDKIDRMAQSFGATTGAITTAPCSGKWRGTSDVSIQFDNGASLFIGNHATPKAKTKKVQQEFVNAAFAQYNPEIISAAKETALPVLKEREARDNAIAAEKGLKPYTLLNVEFNDGTNEQVRGYMGWYYVTLDVDGKICAHMETGLNHDIAGGKVSPAPTRENYYAAGALKESDVDYVFNNVGFSSASTLYSLPLTDAARERAELTLAKSLIDDYCQEEFDSGADFSDLSTIGIGHTTVTDEEIPIQAYANLKDFSIERYLGEVLIESRQYASLDALIQGELRDLDFDDLTYASDAQLAVFHAHENAQLKEMPSLDPSVQPVVTILWSESDKLQEGEKLPLARADTLFQTLDAERRAEREKPGHTGGWYDKTAFRIDFTMNGEPDHYEGRQDFGDGDGSLIDHIQAYHEYYAKDEHWENYVLHNEGAEAWEQDKAQREMILNEFVPYLRLHCNLSEQERTAAEVLENGENLTPEQAAYFNAVLTHVDACREKLNAGEYHLPDPPQLADFDNSLQDYKAHVEEEIAQEAEAADMTVEEYAANDYEPREQPDDTQEQPEAAFAGWEFDGGRVEANKAENRLQVFFDGKPDEAARDELKANGFRWAPSVGAWQRQLNTSAYHAAGYISCIQPTSGEKPIDLQRTAQRAEPTPDSLLTGEQIATPRGSFHVTNMSREQMEAAGYGYHHSSEDGKYLIMGNGTQAFAVTAPQQEQENYLKAAEMSTEQNYNMIDQQINNTPSVDELEEKAKRGEVISLSALAAAVKAEDGRTPQRDPDGKKPSIRAQLKADRAQSAAKPKQKEKEQEAKRSIRQALERE